MRAIPLQSGSAGNAIYVEAAGVRLLVDAGISGARAAERLARHSIDVRTLDAVLISHDHHDHASSAGVMDRKFGLPVYMTPRTHEGAESSCRIGKMKRAVHFRAGDTLTFGPVTVETISTPHDAADGVVFVISEGARRLGIFTDLGHPFPALGPALAALDAVFIESNYDPRMLAEGPYPEYLKARIRGPRGHISNHEAAALLSEYGGRLRWACLSHLSGENNNPTLALGVHREALGGRMALFAADRYEAGEVMEL